MNNNQYLPNDSWGFEYSAVNVHFKNSNIL